MNQLIPTARKFVVGLAAVGALTIGAASLAGAATPTPSATTATSAPPAAAHVSCTRATKVLTRIQRGQAHIAAGLPRLTAAEAKATQSGNTARAARIKRRIDRLESTQFKDRLTKAASAIEARCHVAAPAGAAATS
jgi:hypothetical protein